MAESFNKMIEAIDDFLYTNWFDGGHELWSVLTALRGPDMMELKNYNGTIIYTCADLKAAITAPLRYAVLKHSGSTIFRFIDIGKDCETYAQIRKTIEENFSYDHYIHHAQRAYIALGLTWTKVNKEGDKNG